LGIRKPVEFLGDSLRELKQLPEGVRRQAGRQLDLVQQGKEPVDWKPMAAVGAGVCEIRLRDEYGIYRVIYVAKLADKIYVLHCFQKKTQATSKPDIDLARRRLTELLRELGR
jgi:phage-related protein